MFLFLYGVLFFNSAANAFPMESGDVRSPSDAPIAILADHPELPENLNRGYFRTSGSIDTGLVIGRIVGIEWKGYWKKSGEITFSVGDLGLSGPGGIYSEYRFSVTDTELFNYFLQNESTLSYVLRYKKDFVANPFRQESRYSVVGVFHANIGNDPRDFGLPLEFVEEFDSFEGYNFGSVVGSIVKVQRWGFGSAETQCTLTLDLKTQRRRNRPEFEVSLSHAPPFIVPSLRGSSPALHLEKINLKSENACRYVEKLVSFGSLVRVKFYESHFPEFFDYKKTASQISILMNSRID